MTNIRFNGVMPALITPLNDDSTVRANVVEPMVKWMLNQGIKGFYVLGATGEGGVLSEKERMVMAEATAQAIQDTDAKLILHVGAADVQSAKRLAKHAGQIGADAISSVYPSFFNNYDIEESMNYYHALIDSSGLPMLGYCQSMLQGNDVVPFVKRLMKVEGVIGVKYTFQNYYNLEKIKRINDGDINVMNGPDETLVCGLSMGADGGIGSTYNVMPKKFIDLYEQFTDNNIMEAQKEQLSINKIIDCILSTPLIPTLRVAMEELGFDVGYAAEPARRFTLEERKGIIKSLHEAGWYQDSCSN